MTMDHHFVPCKILSRFNYNISEIKFEWTFSIMSTMMILYCFSNENFCKEVELLTILCSKGTIGEESKNSHNSCINDTCSFF